MQKNNQNNKAPKLFGTDGIRGKANVYPLIPEVALLVGKALVELLRKKNPSKEKYKVIIGKDTRLSGYMFEAALEAGIVSNGGDALLVGPMPTPAIAHLIISMNADAGIVISASHNPSSDNGIKIFNSQGIKLSAEEELYIEERVLHSTSISDDKRELQYTGTSLGKAYRIEEAYGRYIEFAKYCIKATSLQKLKICLDCANGAGYKVAPKIFSELGAEVYTIGIEPNGTNINEECGALHPEKLAKLVKEKKANFGIALDGDADRIITVDNTGSVVHGDKLLALLALELKEKNNLTKNTIVITSMTNRGVLNYLDTKGIKYHETDVGDKYVIQKMHSEKLNFGGEQSGHIIMRDYVTTGDGIIIGLLLAKILIEKNKPLSELIKDIPIWPQKLVNIKVKDKKPINELKSYSLIEKWDKKLKNQKGRINVRYSGTENLCRVMIEAEDSKTVDEGILEVCNAIQKEIGI